MAAALPTAGATAAASPTAVAKQELATAPESTEPELATATIRVEPEVGFEPTAC
jgi:hypothetical protein